MLAKEIALGIVSSIAVISPLTLASYFLDKGEGELQFF